MRVPTRGFPKESSLAFSIGYNCLQHSQGCLNLGLSYPVHHPRVKLLYDWVEILNSLPTQLGQINKPIPLVVPVGHSNHEIALF